MSKRYKYKYTKAPDDYSDKEYSKFKYKGQGNYVDAIYTEAQCPSDRGNPLIEALPHNLDLEELAKSSFRGLKGFDHDELIESKKSDQFARITELNNFRFPLYYQYPLSNEIYNIFLNSYRKRDFIIDYNNLAQIMTTENDKEKDNYVTVQSDAEDGTSGSIAVLGPSGIGKSSTVKIILEHIPQVIVHNIGKDKRFTQITYVHASCNTSANEDFGSMLIDIGRSIDRALNNRAPIYERIISRQKTLGKKVDEIINLIKLFGIGLIIIDEVENLNFDKNKSKSYSKLLSLMNISKVGILLVGTYEAFNKLFDQRDNKMIRRFQPFNILEYTQDETYLRNFLTIMFSYQWFDPIIKTADENGFTKEFLDINKAFSEWTHGVPALVVKLYQCMISEYLLKKQEITPAFIDKVGNKYLSNIKKYMDNEPNPFANKNIKSIIKEVDAQIDYLRLKNSRREEELKMIERLNDNNLQKELLEKEQVVSSVMMLSGNNYSEKLVEDTVNHVYSLKTSENKDQGWKIMKTLEKMGIVKVQEKKTKSISPSERRKLQKHEASKLMDELFESEGEEDE